LPSYEICLYIFFIRLSLKDGECCMIIEFYSILMGNMIHAWTCVYTMIPTILISIISGGGKVCLDGYPIVGHIIVSSVDTTKSHIFCDMPESHIRHQQCIHGFCCLNHPLCCTSDDSLTLRNCQHFLFVQHSRLRNK